MKDRLQSWLNTLQEKWKSLTKSQKYTLAGIAAALIIISVISLFFAFRTNWVQIANINLASAPQVQAALSEEGINSNITALGAVYVPEGSIDAAAVVLASSPALQNTDFVYTFEQAIADSGMGTTATMQHEMLTQALNTRLSSVISQFDGIAQATVTLDRPSANNLLLSLASQPSASVSVVPARPLNRADGEIIATFLSGAVNNLETSNIVVTDTSGGLLWPVSIDDGALAVESVLQFVTLAENLLADRITNLLEPLFGDVRVSPNLVFNFDEVRQTMREYVLPEGADSPEGLVSNIVQSDREITTETQGEGGEPGIGPMIAGAMIEEAGASNIMELVESERNANFLHNVIETLTEGNVGRLLRDESGLAVVATIPRIINQAELVALGVIDNTEASFLEYLQDIPTNIFIDDEITEDVTAALVIATGLENIALIVNSQAVIMHMDQAPPFDVLPIVLIALVLIFVGLLAYGLIRRTSPEELVTEIEPELSVEDLLVSSQLEEEQSEMERLAAIQYQVDSQVKEQIDKFADEMPESLAQLLRNWINEDWE